MKVVTLEGAGPGAGGKARNLRWLIEHRYRVPPGVVVTGADPGGAESLGRELSGHLRPGVEYAVRSSAEVEDSASWSFAGQFDTRLGVAGLDEVVRAVGEVAASAHEPRLRPYLERAGVSPGSVEMAVIVQEMVAAVAAGVAFSRNPLTGLGEIVIESVPGTGAALVSGEASPERWVRRWGDWIERPEAPAAPEGTMEELAEVVDRIGRQRREPVDVEWAWDGRELHLLQVRPLTTRNLAVYSNRISREFLPGMIKPLVWSINVPVVNGAWLELFESLVGPLELRPDDLARQFAYRAYFNMQAVGDVFEALGMPRDLLEVLMGLPGGSDRPGFRPGPRVVRHLPRMARTGWRLLRYDRELDRALPELEQRFAAIEERDLSALSNRELVGCIHELEDLTRQGAFANIVAPLLMNAYGSRLRRRLEKDGIDAHGVDPAAADPALERYDPNRHLDRLAAAVPTLAQPDRDRVAAGDLSVLPGGEEFLDRFGHLSDSGNDFSSVPWREEPARLGPVVLGHRPAAGPGGGEADVPRSRRRLARRAGRFRVERERVSYLYTRGYGSFRPLALEAGRRLVGMDLLESAEDVFHLTRSELEGLLSGDPIDDPGGVARARREEMAALAAVSMPEVIYGEDFEPAPPADPDHRLRGVPTSRGIHRAVARVVSGIGEVARLAPGDVVVIPYSDVGWTPILARSGAIVAESGGMLSHSSIVARELGIPCVVSVDGAMRIPDGAVVRVDGYTGEVQWENPV
ncbi:MAG: PEP/pyruvate-binding domain-containing protein [Acidimicrobiia bacterium]